MKTITIDGVEYNLLPKAKFKVGDWVVFNNSHNSIYQISEIRDSYYTLTHTHGGSMPLSFSQEEFIRPWTIKDAKDGDVLANDHHILILKELVYDWSSNGTPCSVKAYCGIKPNGNFEIGKDNWCFCGTLHIHPATKKQRDLLFTKMKEAGYQWDAGKKELRKIIEPKFKVGDDIKTGSTIETIAEIDYATRSYLCESGRTIWFENQDLWKLAPKKHYAIANFYAGMPVLVRDYNNSQWSYVQFSHLIAERNVGEGGFKFNACGIPYIQCIPFNDDTKHLLGTADMCDEQYINW